MAIAILQGVGGKALQSKSLRIEKDGSYTVEADEGYALEAVDIVVDTPDKKPESELDLGVIKTNGAREFYPSEGEVFNKVAFNVQVPPQGVEQFDERLDGIIALQESYIEDKPEPSEGLEYGYNWGGLLSVKGRGSCTDSVIVIPELVDWDGEQVAVSGLIFEAFYGDAGLTKIYMSSIRHIEDYPLNYCANLEEIYAEGLESIGSFEFCGLPALKYVKFGESLRHISGGVFEGCNNAVFDFTASLTVPTLNSDIDAESGLPKEFGTNPTIKVPAFLYDEWKSATNWTMFADYIVAADVIETTDERLEAIEGNVSKVYEAGSDTGFEAGKQAEYDAFWDEFQRNGTRTSYAEAFKNAYWRGAAYNPKYPITPTASNGCDGMFAWNTSITDTKVPITIYGPVTSMFGYNMALVRIPKLIWNGVTNVSGMFASCDRLEELNCEGIIDITGVNLQWSTKLSKASIESVISCLSDTTSGLSVTFSKTARTNAFTDDEWAALIATKPNWTISLV